MHQRINITLPETTVRLLDEKAPNGSRSRFIDQAIRHFIQTQSRNRLREALKEGAIARAARGSKMVEAWFALDEEAWQPKSRASIFPNVGKFISLISTQRLEPKFRKPDPH